MFTKLKMKYGDLPSDCSILWGEEEIELPVTEITVHKEGREWPVVRASFLLGDSEIEIAKAILEEAKVITYSCIRCRGEEPRDVIETLLWNTSPRWPFPKKTRDLSKIRYITIHHSGTTTRQNTSIEAWNAYHTKTKSWSHIGYHFCIGYLERGGRMGLYQTNRIEQITWHDARNYDTIGVVIAGDLRTGKDDTPTAEQADLFGRLIAWLMPQLPGPITIVGHNHFQRTACPGSLDVWYNMLERAMERHGRPMKIKLAQRGFATRAFGVASNLYRGGPPTSSYEDV